MAPGPLRPARVLHSTGAGFGLTTLALVGLASTGTGLLVAHGTRQLQPPAHHALARAPLTPTLTPVLVDRAPGTLLPPAPLPVRTVRVVTVPQRTTHHSPVAVVPVPPAVPPVAPPVVPPVVVPPVEPPPVVAPPVVTPSTSDGKKKAHPAHPVHPDDNGKHLGQDKHS